MAPGLAAAPVAVVLVLAADDAELAEDAGLLPGAVEVAVLLAAVRLVVVPGLAAAPFVKGFLAAPVVDAAVLPAAAAVVRDVAGFAAAPAVAVLVVVVLAVDDVAAPGRADGVTLETVGFGAVAADPGLPADVPDAGLDAVVDVGLAAPGLEVAAVLFEKKIR